eukprot:2262369-Pleurochrysis_carterae.AAC.2
MTCPFGNICWNGQVSNGPTITRRTTTTTTTTAARLTFVSNTCRLTLNIHNIDKADNSNCRLARDGVSKGDTF